MSSAEKWVIFLVAYDDPEIEPQVLVEAIPVHEDENLAAFLRGGQVLDVLTGEITEAQAESARRAYEKSCLR
jgi:hypothetical protein